jgi:tetratricopeptide (TPR) repeat protein
VRWLLDHAKALADLGRWDEARVVYHDAIEVAPADPAPRVEMGRFAVARGELERAADAFAQAWRLDPESIEWPMYLAQVELLRGRWAEGWAGYRWREQRLRFEAAGARAGAPYLVPSLAALRGGPLTLVREQGLGDELFFLRMAPALRAADVRLDYAGDARLLPLLARTCLFEGLRDIEREPPRPGERVLLTADLPLVVDALFAPTLAIAPREDMLGRMRARLEAAGPRPWIGLTWRSGTPRALDAEALSKEVPLEVLAAAVAPLPGTPFALQRGATPAELARLSSLLARPVHPLRDAAEDLEESLALTTLLDRHVAVSSTNMHLAAGAGATADVLVPYPPEWRWRMEGDSPWFPGFRIHRQERDGRWDIRL